MKAGIEAAKEKPVEVLIYAVRGSRDDLVKVVQPEAIVRDPLQVMKIADDLGVDGLGEAAAYSAVNWALSFKRWSMRCSMNSMPAQKQQQGEL